MPEYSKYKDVLYVIDLDIDKSNAEFMNKLWLGIWIITVVIFTGIIATISYQDSSLKLDYQNLQKQSTEQINKLTIEKNVLLEAKSCK